MCFYLPLKKKKKIVCFILAFMSWCCVAAGLQTVRGGQRQQQLNSPPPSTDQQACSTTSCWSENLAQRLAISFPINHRSGNFWEAERSSCDVFLSSRVPSEGSSIYVCSWFTQLGVSTVLTVLDRLWSATAVYIAEGNNRFTESSVEYKFYVGGCLKASSAEGLRASFTWLDMSSITFCCFWSRVPLIKQRCSALVVMVDLIQLNRSVSGVSCQW